MLPVAIEEFWNYQTKNNFREACSSWDVEISQRLKEEKTRDFRDYLICMLDILKSEWKIGFRQYKQQMASTVEEPLYLQ